MTELTPNVSSPLEDGLPTLPSMEALRSAARQRVEHFTQVRDYAQRMIDEANAYLGEPPAVEPIRRRASPGSQPPDPVSDATYRRVLFALGNHEYAGLSTVESEARVSNSTAARVLRVATTRGHATRSVRARGKLRYKITDEGQEYLTCPEGEASA